MKARKAPTTLMLSLISTFAALNIIADSIPLTPVIGMPGTYFRLGWIMAPLTGILLGPLLGSVSCIVASLVELFLGIQPWSFGVFSPLRAGFSALQSGLVSRGEWRMAMTILGLLIVSWVLLPSGRGALLVLSFSCVSCLLIMIFRGNVREHVYSTEWKKVSLGFAVASYCGNISRYLLGNILLIVLADWPSILFLSAIPFTVIEQMAFAIASTILGVAVSRTGVREVLVAQLL